MPSEFDLHVNGPALIELNLSAGSGDWVKLGYSEDGVRCELQAYHEDIYADFYGPNVPADVAFMGQTAMIMANLISWDDTILKQIEARLHLNGQSGFTVPEVGQVRAADIGTLIFSAGLGFQIRYTSSTRTGLAAEPYRQFVAGYLADSLPFSVGTRVTRVPISVRCIPRNNVLYTRVQPTA